MTPSLRSLAAPADELRTRLSLLCATLIRLGVSHFPAYWMTGGRVVELAADFS